MSAIGRHQQAIDWVIDVVSHEASVATGEDDDHAAGMTTGGTGCVVAICGWKRGEMLERAVASDWTTWPDQCPLKSVDRNRPWRR